MATYELGKVIGHGGMAVVHEARKVMPDGGRFPVAIKRIHGRFAQDPDLIQFLCREGAVCMQVSNGHPNLVSVFEIDRDAQDQLFLVMERVDGVTLQDLLVGDLLTVPFIRRINCDMLRALAHVHSHGVVHRDISPCNILTSCEGHIKLSDFGLATSSDTGQSIYPGFKGKAAYASPESIQVGKIGPSSDLFSLAATIYHLLTKKLPFGTGTIEQIHRRMNIWQFEPLPSSVPSDLQKFVHGQIRYRLEERAFDDAEQAIAMMLEHGGEMASDADVGHAVERARGKREVPGTLRGSPIARDLAISRCEDPAPDLGRTDTVVAPARVTHSGGEGVLRTDVLPTMDSRSRSGSADPMGRNIARNAESPLEAGRGERESLDISNAVHPWREARKIIARGNDAPGNDAPENDAPESNNNKPRRASTEPSPRSRSIQPASPAQRGTRWTGGNWLASIVIVAMLVGLYVVLWPRPPRRHHTDVDPIDRAMDRQDTQRRRSGSPSGHNRYETTETPARSVEHDTSWKARESRYQARRQRRAKPRPLQRRADSETSLDAILSIISGITPPPGTNTLSPRPTDSPARASPANSSPANSSPANSSPADGSGETRRSARPGSPGEPRPAERPRKAPDGRYDFIEFKGPDP